MDVSVGQEIDGYQILDVLGRGGMGVVYLAEDVALSRNVALKVIDPALARDEAFLRRFRAEARALARIDSPHIVRVHALRQTDIGVFIVMEYVEGGTLADPIGRGPMPWQKALPLIKQMLHAFSHAHGVGVIHRDIKPSNIMLTPQGVVKVTDFGLAKLHQKNADATVTQGISGTLFYMSPEQVKGQRDIDHRTDLYSLGMTIYEMLAGRVPLDRSEGQFTVLKRIVEEKPVPPTHFAPQLPAGLVRIVMKALEKDPADRYQSAEEMLQDLEAFESSASGSVAAEEIRSSPTVSPALRRPLYLGAAALIGVLLVVAGILAYRTWIADGTSAMLTVTSAPEGAMVFVGEQFVGTTPLRDRPVDEGRVSMRLSKDGFVTVDTTLLVERGRPLMLDLQMIEATSAGTASATITSTPEDAEVWIDGDLVGRTPYTLEAAAAGMLTVYLRKDGFEDLELQQELLPGEDRLIAAVLNREDSNGGGGSTTQPPSQGMLVVQTEGSGRIEVDGRQVSAGSPLTLAAGSHRVACGEGTHRMETGITVVAGASRSVTCHFRSKVNVVTTMSDGTSTWASVWINGQNQGLAPAELTLDPGTYRIAVRRDGFSVLDDEKTITVKPSLEPQTEHLAFRISRQ